MLSLIALLAGLVAGAVLHDKLVALKDKVKEQLDKLLVLLHLK